MREARDGQAAQHQCMSMGLGWLWCPWRAGCRAGHHGCIQSAWDTCLGIRKLRTQSKPPSPSTIPMLEKVLGAGEVCTYSESCANFCTTELGEESSRKETLTLAAGCQLFMSPVPALLLISGGLSGFHADVADQRVNAQNPERSNLQRDGRDMQVRCQNLQPWAGAQFHSANQQ